MQNLGGRASGLTSSDCISSAVHQVGRAGSVERSSHAASGESLPRSPVSPIARVLISRPCSSGPWWSNLCARSRVVGLSPHARVAWFSSTPLTVRARPLLSRPIPMREDRGRQERPLSSPRCVGLWRVGRRDLDAGSGCARGAKPGCRFLARSVDLRRGLFRPKTLSSALNTYLLGVELGPD